MTFKGFKIIIYGLVGTSGNSLILNHDCLSVSIIHSTSVFFKGVIRRNLGNPSEALLFHLFVFFSNRDIVCKL